MPDAYSSSQREARLSGKGHSKVSAIAASDGPFAGPSIVPASASLGRFYDCLSVWPFLHVSCRCLALFEGSCSCFRLRPHLPRRLWCSASHIASLHDGVAGPDLRKSHVASLEIHSVEEAVMPLSGSVADRRALCFHVRGHRADKLGAPPGSRGCRSVLQRPAPGPWRRGRRRAGDGAPALVSHSIVYVDGCSGTDAVDPPNPP